MSGLVELATGTLAVAFFVAVGLAWTAAAPALRGLPWHHRIGFAYPLGVASVSATLWALSFVLAVPVRRPAILAVGLAFGAIARLAAAARSRRHPPRPGPGADPGPRARARTVAAPRAASAAREGPPAPRAVAFARVLPGVAIGVVCAGVWTAAATGPLRDFDGRMTWAATARYVQASGSALPAALTEERWSVAHPRYPLLLPIAQSVALELTAGCGGRDSDATRFRVLYAAFLPALLLVAHHGARRFAGRAASTLAVLALGFLPFVTHRGEGGALTAYSDLPLAVFFGAGLLLLLRTRGRAGRPGDALAAGVLLAGATLAKNEGLPLALAALLLAGSGRFLAARRSRRRRPSQAVAMAILASAPVALAIVLLAAWRSAIPNRLDESYGSLLSVDRFVPEVVTRVLDLAPLLAERTADWANWRGYWIVWLAVVLAGAGVASGRAARRRLAVSVAPFVLAAAAPLAVGWLAYTAHWDAPALARVTWERFLTQASMPTTLILALALRLLLRSARPSAR